MKIRSVFVLFFGFFFGFIFIYLLFFIFFKSPSTHAVITEQYKNHLIPL